MITCDSCRWSKSKSTVKAHAAVAEFEQQLRAMTANHAAEVKHLMAELSRTETMASNRAEHFQGEIQRLNADHAADRIELEQVCATLGILYLVNFFPCNDADRIGPATLVVKRH